MSVHSHPPHEQVLENRLALRLAAALAEQAEAIPHDLAERLRVARMQALARARLAQAAQAQPVRSGLRPAAVAVLAGPRSGPSGRPVPWWRRAATALPLVVLVAGFVMVHRVAEVEQVRAAADIDSQLLSDSLPPAAYADPGFAEFLRQPPP
ncbi:MAG: hypothetical protein AMXMBFR66_27050 [Pseudomonadota bacterium]|nr:DUF3619 family protein [Rubrivivax sp.]NLZ40682.1 DUF3619 family protein [Comamonadaceae bacterium]